MSIPILRHYRRAGWAFTYEQALDQVMPTAPAGMDAAVKREHLAALRANKKAVVRALREEAALDRLDTARLTSAEKAEVDRLADADVSSLEEFVDRLVRSIQQGEAA